MSKKNRTLIFVYIIILALLYSSCLKDKSPVTPEENYQWVVDTTLIEVIVSEVDSSRIWQNLLHLTSYPDRANYGDNIVQAGQWLYDYMEDLGFEVNYHKYLWISHDQIFFTNRNFGVIRSNRDPARGMVTHDGGKTWQHIIMPEGRIFFLNEQTGFVTFDERYVYATTDGGMNWEERNSTLGGSQIYFIDKNHGWMNDDRTLYKTVDGGYTWHDYPATYKKARNFFIADSLHFWTSTYDGILITEDGGLNWSEVELDDFAEQIFMFNLNEGIIRHGTKEVLFTQDGGYTWQPASGFIDQRVKNVFGISSGNAWGTYIDQILYSSDSGLNWIERSKVKWSCHDLFFTDSLTGWASTSWGLYKTYTGGMNWVYQIDNFPMEVTFENIVCTFPGKIYPEKEILLIGHYDTVYGSVGADDNSSGLVALLEMAEILSQYDFAYTIKIIFFSNEENQIGGSRHYAFEAKERGDEIIAVLNFDAIGYWVEGLPKDLDIEYNEKSEWLADEIIHTADCYTSVEVNKSLQLWSAPPDHRAFWNKGYYAVWFFEAGTDEECNPYMNSSGDKIEHVNRSFLSGNIKVGIISAAHLAEPVVKSIK